MKTNDTFGYRGDRVRAHTAGRTNQQIDRKTQEDVRVYTAIDSSGIESRIGELEREWDIERVLETHASALALLGLAVAWRGDKRWLALPSIVAAFLFQHALQGWCPPLGLFRRLGIRTQREIEAEKYALKALQKRETSKTSSPSTHLSVGMV